MKAAREILRERERASRRIHCSPPKPPWSSYLFFVHENRKKIRRDLLEGRKVVSAKDVARETLRRWKRLSKNDVLEYKKKEQADIDRYEMEKKEYERYLSSGEVEDKEVLTPTTPATISSNTIPSNTYPAVVKDIKHHDNFDVYVKPHARLDKHGNLTFVQKEEIALRPKKPEIKPLNFYRLYANRSCVGSDERPLMPSLRSQYIEFGLEFKEILLNRDFDTSNAAYRRMLTGGGGEVEDEQEAGDEDRKQKQKTQEKAKRDARIVWNKSCPLRRVRLHRGGYHIQEDYFIISIYTVGINGRIYSAGSNAPRYIEIEAYDPKRSKRNDLKLEMPDLPNILGDLPRRVVKSEMRAAGLNPDAIDNPEMLVPLRESSEEETESSYFRGRRLVLWKDSEKRRRVGVVLSDTNKKLSSSTSTPPIETKTNTVKLVPVSNHPSYIPYLDKACHMRAVSHLLQPGHRQAVIDRLMKLIYFSKDRVLCISRENQSLKTKSSDILVDEFHRSSSVTSSGNNKIPRRNIDCTCILLRRLYPSTRMIISVYVKAMYGRCFYVQAYVSLLMMKHTHTHTRHKKQIRP